ncbi:MAG TPA: hypothetical protein VHC22_32555 [Pirellulales bacterium]|nr:hypothetical protein [Pirellulales bacterium]
MGRKYSINGSRAVASSVKTVAGLTSTSAIRPRIADVMFGTSGTPADNALNWTVQRYTAAGTSTAVTPQALDPGDPAATATAGSNHTVEPTYTSGAILLDIDANQRSTQRWVAAQGYELVLPATASNGAGLATSHASYTGNVDCTVLYEE